ncbi:putative MFS monosaccharide transporter, partial [Aureobasidium melanogenum]
ASLITNPSLRRRTITACLTMTFQQWNGINAINYYAPFIFQNFGFTGNTTSLLATGVVGVIEFLLTIPAVLYVDKFGRKSILLAGAIGMATCHFIVAGLIGSYEGSWGSHVAAGWVCIVFVWVFIGNFAYSWGPVSWIVVSEVFPLSMRAKGVSLGGSANWLNNFAVGLSTSPFIEASQFGAFIFFGCITVVAALWVFFLLPETKGLTLEEMDELFGDAGFAEADLALKAKIERDIGLTALLYGDEEPTTTEKVGGLGKGEEREFKEDTKSISVQRSKINTAFRARQGESAPSTKHLTIPAKRAREADAQNPLPSKRQKQIESEEDEEGLLTEVDVSAERLDLKFWSTAAAYLHSGDGPAADTARRQHMLENLYNLGKAQQKQHGFVSGTIALATLKMAYTASRAPAFQKKKGTTKASKGTMAASKDVPSDEDDDSEEDDSEEDDSEEDDSEEDDSEEDDSE